MDLTIELNRLTDYFNKRDTDGFKSYLKELFEKCSPEEKEVVTLFVETSLENSTERIKNTVNDIRIRMQLENVIDILPLSYISKKY